MKDKLRSKKIKTGAHITVEDEELSYCAVIIVLYLSPMGFPVVR